MALNPNEAPKGFVAVEDDSADACDRCHVRYMSRLCLKQRCDQVERTDKCNVRYRHHPIAIWAYDSEGTPV